MIAVQVTYRVKPEFVEENIKNINAFLGDFKEMKAIKFLYNVYIKKDGHTFVHTSMYETDETQQQVLHLPSFKFFQEQRDQHGLIEPPVIEELDLIGTSLGLIK